MPRTVFLDRDGVINFKAAEGRYITSWSEFKLLPDADAALAQLTRAGFRLIVVTNQRGVARGVMACEDVDDIHKRMCAALRLAGAHIEAVYCCPHEIGVCDCRKPGTGLFRQARSDYPDIEFSQSFVVGDSLNDIQAGKALGATTILVGEDPPPDAIALATHVAPNLSAVAALVAG